jgi:hypothetical protein
MVLFPGHLDMHQGHQFQRLELAITANSTEATHHINHPGLIRRLHIHVETPTQSMMKHLVPLTVQMTTAQNKKEREELLLSR